MTEREFPAVPAVSRKSQPASPSPPSTELAGRRLRLFASNEDRGLSHHIRLGLFSPTFLGRTFGRAQDDHSVSDVALLGEG